MQRTAVTVVRQFIVSLTGLLMSTPVSTFFRLFRPGSPKIVLNSSIEKRLLAVIWCADIGGPKVSTKLFRQRVSLRPFRDTCFHGPIFLPSVRSATTVVSCRLRSL